MTQVSFSDFVAGVSSGQALVSFPTDTVPALAARPDQAALIFQAKQRDAAKPLILMGAQASDLWPFVSGSPEELEIWQQVAAQHWPGALTLVLPASDRLPAAMNPTNPTTIGIRVPNRAIARHILAHTAPLATTSANRSGEPPLENLPDIEQAFPAVLVLAPSELERLERQLEPSPPKNSGVPSTVAQWNGSGWTILRLGGVEL